MLRGGSGFGAPPGVRALPHDASSYQSSIRYSSLIVIEILCREGSTWHFWMTLLT